MKNYQEYLKQRIIKEANLMAQGSTVREVAKEVGVSKSSVHKDMTLKLRDIDATLYNQVTKIIIHNKMERHLRGGEATKLKYSKVS